MFDSAETSGKKAPSHPLLSSFICLGRLGVEYAICPFSLSCLSPNYDAGDSAVPGGGCAARAGGREPGGDTLAPHPLRGWQEQHHSCHELHRGSAAWARRPTRSDAPMLRAMPGCWKHHPGRRGPGGPGAITSAAARAAGSQRRLLRSENKAEPQRSPGTSAH